MKTFILTVISFFLSVCSYGTSQTPDKIIYKGQEYALNTNPLEIYFLKNPDLRPKSEIMSTGLWRG